MRSLTSALATERARLTVAGARHYPGLLPGTWYEVAPRTDDELGGCYLRVGGAERYVWREWFHVESVGVPGTPARPRS